MALQDYIRGRRKGRQARDIEFEALGDPFLGEALEGFDSVDADHGAALDRLSERLAARVDAAASVPARVRPIWRRPAVWATAAALAVCLLIGGVVMRVYNPAAVVPQYADNPARSTVPAPESPSSEAELPDGPTAIEDAPSPVEITVPDVLNIVQNDPVSGSRPSAVFEMAEADEIMNMAPVYKTEPIAEAKRAGGTVTGRVTGPDGQPIIGASVVVPETGVGTYTDLDGRFYLNGLAPGSTVQVHMLGFESSQVSVSGDGGNFDIILRENISDIDDIVVIGYGTQRKSIMTGTVSGMRAGKTKKDRSGKASKIREEPTKESPGKPVPVQGTRTASGGGLDPGSDLYRRMRDSINEGKKPSAGSVDVEQMVNHFAYHHIEPLAKEPLNMAYEVGPCPWTRDNLLVVIVLTAGEKPLKDITLDIRPETAGMEWFRLVGSDSAGQSEITVPATLGAREGSVILYEVALAESAPELSLMTVEAAYREQGRRRAKQVATPVIDTGRDPSTDFYFASAVAMFGELLRGSPFVAGADYDLVIRTARLGERPADNGKVEEFINLVRSAGELDRK